MNNELIGYRYIIVLILTIGSFWFTYTSLSRLDQSKYAVSDKRDNLSGENYNSGGVYNYKDNNPYGSYFVGFDQLTDRGIRNEEWLYISDVLTNFTMYNQKTYNGTISFVKDSFVRDTSSGDFVIYSFKFGINDTIYTMKVQSSWVQEKIKLLITNGSSKQVFSKDFAMYED